MKLKIILACICLITVMFGISCKLNEPLISSESLEEIEKKLGYVLAPTYMPEGYEYGSLKEVLTQAEGITRQPVYLFYHKEFSSGETLALMMEYPIEDNESSSSFLEQFGLIKPDDASTEIDINGMTATLNHGGWTEETKERVSKLEFPIEPEWDYDYGTSIRFYVEVPENEKVHIQLTTSLPISDSELSEEEMIKIAESVVVVE
ncbi:DUF4367 domain-containing protein [Chloroflexota bacterium]